MYIEYVKSKPSLYRGWRGIDIIVESDADKETVAKSIADFLEDVLHYTKTGRIVSLDTENVYSYYAVFGSVDEFTLKDIKDAVSVLDKNKDKLKILNAKKISESIVRISQDDRFKKFTDDEDFLSALQVASDEFAYDYKDDLTETAKNIFKDVDVDIAIYDFGGDVDLDKPFDIILSIKDDSNNYYETNTGRLPASITEKQIKAMQDFNYSLISKAYKRYIGG